jgi:hypothetical protein
MFVLEQVFVSGVLIVGYGAIFAVEVLWMLVICLPFRLVGGAVAVAVGGDGGTAYARAGSRCARI